MTAKRKKRPATKTQAQAVITPGSTVRFEEPSSKRGQKQKRTTVFVQEFTPVNGFVDFLREHAVVSLAVGFAIATQAQSLIKQLISSFIDPLYGLLFSEKLSKKVFELNFHGRTQEFGWGAFMYSFIDFLFVLAAIYIIIKLLKLDKLNKPKEEEE